MAVYQRDYGEELNGTCDGSKVYAYSFSYRKARYRESGFTTKREAELAENLKKQEVMFGTKLTRVTGDIRFSALVDLFFENRSARRACTTVASELQKAKRLKKAFGKRNVREISVADVLNYQTRRTKAGRAARTVNLELTLLRCIFRHAIDHEYASENPAKAVKNLRETRTDKKIPTDDEFQRLIVEAEKTPAGRQLTVWMWMAAYCGARPSELFHIEWSDVDWQRNQIFIRPKADNPLKTGRFRVVEIHPNLRPILLRWKQEWDATFARRGTLHDWVFFNPRKPSWRAKSFKRCFETAREKAGLKYVNLYTFRHYFISRAIESGVDIYTVSRWAGHKNTKMIEEVYGHLSPGFRQQQMARVKIGTHSEQIAGA